jgi:RNA polymerase sigma-70 factor (ECF subfamily)
VPDTTNDPCKLAAWGDFHQAVASLGEEDRELFDLLWYQGLTQRATAGILGVSERTIYNRWLLAKERLGGSLGGHLPV